VAPAFGNNAACPAKLAILQADFNCIIQPIPLAGLPEDSSGLALIQNRHTP
jgi:hypothetical protein